MPQYTGTRNSSFRMNLQAKKNASAKGNVMGHTISARRLSLKLTGSILTAAVAHLSTPAIAQGASTERTSTGSAELSEIIVTAQKREERLKDVPVAVAVVNTARLADTNQTNLQDIYLKVPGLNLTTVEPFGSSTLAIRGLITGLYQAPTVGVIVDDVPYTATTTVGFGNAVPDLDPSDLARIEVLKGPQGTLYGASSMGGLIKYVTTDPSLDAVRGRIQAGLSGIENGDRVGFNVRGAINMPLGSRAAIRASAFTRVDPGFVDDPTHGKDGVNWGKASGGRISFLWQPTDALKVRLGALLQDLRTYGTGSVATGPGFGEFEQNAPPRSGGYRKQLQVYSANVDADLGSAELASITAYSVTKNKFRFDFTPFYGAFANSLFPAVTGSTSVQDVRATKFTQELRLTVPLSENIEWLIGGFYNHENVPRNFQQVFATDFDTGVPAGEIAYLIYGTTLDEYAAFTDLTVTLSDQFDVQLGGRQSFISQDFNNSGGGPLLGGAFAQPEAHAKSNAFTYLLTPRFRISHDLMIYARFASGYRPGGPNGGTALNPVLPTEFGPDKTMSYELGLKGSVLDKALSFEASLYHIDWKDIQLQFQDPATGITYYDNGSKARSRGVELSLNARPAHGLSLSGSASYNDAKLTQDLPATAAFITGLKGDRLPFGARWTYNASADYEVELGADVSAFVGGEVSYIGKRQNVFTATGVRGIFPAYTRFDLRAGARWREVKLSLFLNNATDRRGVVSNGYLPGTINYIQPRTFGFNLAYAF